MKLDKLLFTLAAALGAACALAAPQATIESFSQAADLTVTVTYRLTGGPAVVTLGALDSSGNPVSDAAFSCVQGDVNKEVANTAGEETRTIVWDPAHSAVNLGTAVQEIRPVLTAWPLDDAPDYMVVDLSENSLQRVRYYTSTNALPGGLFGNVAYRTTMLVLRKIPAKGVKWTMGSAETEQGRNPDAASGTDPEKQHAVEFDNNYYIAIFPTTQGQWYFLAGVNNAASTKCPLGRMFRPMDSVSYCMVRECATSSNSENASHQYPNPPHASSFLGILNARTGLSFDLPSDAEWEYACRAGWGDCKWGNGADYEYAKRQQFDARVPGRYRYNQANTALTLLDQSNPDAWNYTEKIGPENSTAMVGSYAPNDWGVYDMHGNVFEWCLDGYTVDITNLGGAVNTDAQTQSGGTWNGSKWRVRRGGAWFLPTVYFRSACRYFDPSRSNNASNGFRVKLGAAKNAN